jgi:hypothetical protein
MIKLTSFDPKKNKWMFAGKFDFDTFVFHKKVNNRHFMVIENGWGVSEDVVQQLIQLDCKYIFIETKKKEYKFPFQELFKQPIKNYGHGNQRFIGGK